MGHGTDTRRSSRSSRTFYDYSDKSWMEDSAAWYKKNFFFKYFRDHFCSVLTSLYALFIIVFAVVVELSQKFTPDEWFSETVNLKIDNEYY